MRLETHRSAPTSRAERSLTKGATFRSVDDRQQEQLAANEDLFRQINERIEDIAAEHGADSHAYEFLCECSDTGCAERVRLTLDEYRHVREDGTRFIVVKGHVVKEIERGQYDSFVEREWPKESR